MRVLFFNDPLGAAKSPEDAFSRVKPGIIKPDERTPRSMTVAAVTRLPKPPFLVPAVIEALRNSQDWAPLIQVVPGEADTYCAQDVRQNGGIVLTSDSDLLVQDLGADGRVSFFWDVEYISSAALSTSMYSFHDINDQLGVRDVGGLPRVVFEQITDRIAFDAAVRKAKENNGDTLTSPGYLSFVKGHQVNDAILTDDATLAAISNLDPRISEIVIQTIIMRESGWTPGTPSKRESRGPKVLSMFLPTMTENRGIKSCWMASTETRKIAYGVLQTLSPRRSENIIEYRTLDRSNDHNGRRLDIPWELDTMDGCKRLVATLGNLKKRLPSPGMQWLAFAILQGVEVSAEDERVSLSAILLSQANLPSIDAHEYSWDLIHYTAQVQASYYSLRMARQILDAVAALGQDLPKPFRELRESLASLPLIADWPTIEDMPSLLSIFKSQDALNIVTDVLGVPRINLDQVLAESTGPKRHKRKQQSDAGGNNGGGNGMKRSPSLNPFAILSSSSQE